MADCIFCKIGKREIQSMVVHDDPEILAFRDINPQAPVHILVIPKNHYDSIQQLEAADAGLLGRMMLVAKQIAKQEKIATRGFRLVVNSGEDGGQSVAHLHLHLLGGRAMSWPPG